MVFLELRRHSRVTTGSQPSPWVGPGKPNLPLGLRGKAGGCTRVTAGPKRPHLGLCPGLKVPLKGRQGSRGGVPTPQGSQASSRGQAKDAALLSSRDADLLESTEWPQGSQASSSVWREDSGLRSGSGRKRRPSPREDGGFSGVSSSCGARGGFSRGKTRISGSLSCGAREVRSLCAWRGGARHGSRVMGED